MTHITLCKPDDWHCHLRDDEAMKAVAPYTARQFARAIVMPNLKPPITTVASAWAYRQRILATLPKNSGFDPLMTLYLTDKTTPKHIVEISESRYVYAVKYYPAGATTNSDSGVTNIVNCYDALAAMENLNVPLLVHGEVTDATVDIFDRERVFIDRVLEPLHQRFPRLRIVFEHITTEDAANFVRDSNDKIAATITPQHLLLNRNAMLAGGIRPHLYCLPVLKRERHRQALLEVAVSGNPKFFLGTDSAPHARGAKESACGCAGIFSAHAAIELYATAFEEANGLQKLEGFASHFGADFYGLPRNTDTVTLAKESWEVPANINFGGQSVQPFYAGEKLHWKLQ